MSDVNILLNRRLGPKEKSHKMLALAQKSANGQLNGFAGIFAVSALSPAEATDLERILQQYATESTDIAADLQALAAITSEVKAITNQAAILHGERIKRAHEILTSYQEGAFTSWLMATYGNRQTPYNLWHYYEFYQAIPKELRPQLESMPRQAVYALASREGKFDAKQRIVQEYNGETKQELLAHIRKSFPLPQDDQRVESAAESAMRLLKRALAELQASPRRLSPGQRRELLEVMNDLDSAIRG